jgi:uncharacterized protein YcnI
MKRAGRSLAMVVLTAAVVGLWAGAASAHVTASPGEAPADGYTVQTFALGHGCEDSPTTQIKIQMPESIPQVAPSVNVNWDVEKVMETLDEPLDTGEGEALTERVSEVVYTAKTPLPDGLRDSFELSMKMPDTPDETLYFPVVQVCETGETAWIEIPEEGATEEPEHPAPAVTITAAEGDGHGGGEDAAEDEAATVDAELAADGADEQATSDSDDDSSSNTLAIVAIVIGVVALVVGGVGLARAGKS